MNARAQFITKAKVKLKAKHCASRKVSGRSIKDEFDRERNNLTAENNTRVIISIIFKYERVLCDSYNHRTHKYTIRFNALHRDIEY